MLPKWRIFSEPDPVPAEKAHPGDILLAEFFDKHFYPHAEATRRRPRIVKYVFDRHMRSGLGQIKLGDLSSFALDEWIRGQINQRYKPGTINKHIFLVNRMLNVALNWGLIEKKYLPDLSDQTAALGRLQAAFSQRNGTAHALERLHTRPTSLSGTVCQAVDPDGRAQQRGAFVDLVTL